MNQGNVNKVRVPRNFNEPSLGKDKHGVPGQSMNSFNMTYVSLNLS